MTTSSPSDVELVAGTRAGEATAFAAIVRRYQGAVCAVACAAAGDRQLGEDAAQETFVAAWRTLDHLQQPERLGPWLCRIARNRGHSARRRQARVPQASTQTERAADPVALDEAAGDRELEALVWRTLERLPPRYRDPLVLFHREGESVAAVATLLGEHEATVRQRLHRGRTMLRDEVHARLDRVLRRAVPGAAFTAAVLAAVPDAGASATGGSATIGTATWALGLLGAAAALVLALGRGREQPPEPSAAVREDAPPRQPAVDAPTAPPPGWREQLAGAGPREVGDDDDDDPLATHARLHVTDMLGGAIEGARVIGAADRELGRTDTGGIVALRLPAPEDGDRPIRIDAEGYAIGFADLAGGGDVTVQLTPEAVLRGRVVDEQGRPITDATVWHRTRAFDERTHPTDGRGEFVVDRLAAGPLMLSIRAPGYVTRVAGVRVGAMQREQLEFVLRPGATIVGRVHASGALPDDLEAFHGPAERGGPRDHDGELPPSMRDHAITFGGGAGILRTVEVDDDGGFVIDGVPPGRWRVQLQSQQAAMPDDAVEVELVPGQRSAEVTLRLPPLQHFAFVLRDDAGAAVPDVTVHWMRQDDPMQYVCTSDAAGRCDAAATGGTLTSIRRGGEIQTTSLAIADGLDVPLLVPRAPEATASLRGRVVDAAGVPAASRAIHLQLGPSAEAIARGEGPVPQRRTLFTDDDGNFAIAALPPGEVRVLVLPATRAAGEALGLVPPLLAMGRISPLVEARAQLIDDAATELALRLPGRSITVRGEVVDTGGEPVPEAWVTCSSATSTIDTMRRGGTPVAQVLSELDGRFACEGLLDTEPVTISAAAPEGARGSVELAAGPSERAHVIVAEPAPR
ncbi:MAG: sigma-70 family RNA polymerase sigma factor [Nannocystaceae bacterium]